ncbi:hypothetical protein LPC08_12685 [Roseomonas sp. OT10]|uniref:hypothetical protein n=1 Tax=Roseomonas cutis TaxID=2897332 RepID=UPI001E2FBE02|nr:hypothetical protein [Roseomonas sp. OT10]UFN46886.1 hypothetical protein LPC08_12685 [Roseomonas sp. OT10]
MATLLKMQLSTPPAITRDTTVEMVNAATGERRTTKPFLDGTVSVAGIAAGEWEVQVRHPNFLADLFRRRIRIFPDRPTFIPIPIPANLFENTPIANTPDADLGPVQTRLAASAETADRQARKRAGQPIFADDWNELSSVVAEVARGTKDLTTLVSPIGHDHPEIVAKIEEQASNLQRLFDVFGEAVSQLQREVQILGLQNRVEDALDALPDAKRTTFKPRFQTLLRNLDEARGENPQNFTARLQRIAADLSALVQEATADEPPVVLNSAAVVALSKATAQLQVIRRSSTFLDEVAEQNKVNRNVGLGNRPVVNLR